MPSSKLHYILVQERQFTEPKDQPQEALNLAVALRKLLSNRKVSEVVEKSR